MHTQPRKMIGLSLLAVTLLLILPTVASAQNTAATPPAPLSTAGATEKITFTDVNVDGPYIAMTFDDGPHGTNTPKLLEMAAKRHIKLTFFVLGECVEQNPTVLQREVAEGHEIGNHSWSHPNLAKLSDEAVRSQLQRTEDIIVKTAGVKPKLMRPPYGELTKRQRIWVNRDFGYKVILWDVDPLDWKRPGPSVVARRIIAYIVRMHRAGRSRLRHARDLVQSGSCFGMRCLRSGYSRCQKSRKRVAKDRLRIPSRVYYIFTCGSYHWRQEEAHQPGAKAPGAD